jgi:two-component system cell cycle sensor histidine kinase/response regulator CckA
MIERQELALSLLVSSTRSCRNKKSELLPSSLFHPIRLPCILRCQTHTFDLDNHVLPRTFICLLMLGCSVDPIAASWNAFQRPDPIASAQEIRNLSAEEASAARPVKLKGVITHINPHLNDFFLQDKSAGIYVHPTELAKGLLVGDWIEVEGQTDPGDFAPCVSARKINRLGQNKLPDPFAFTLATEDSRWLDGQWIQTSVVIRTIRTDPNVTRLDVYNAYGTAVVIIPGQEWASEAQKFIDVAVTIRGVCVPTFAKRMISGPPKIYATGLSQITALPIEPGNEPDAPPRLIDHLLRFTPAPNPGGRRVKVAGVVTARPLPGMVVIQDSSGGAAIYTSSPRTDIPIGARIEAFGLLQVEGRRISLIHARTKLLNEAPQPPAIPINGTEMCAGIWDFRRVQIEAQLEKVGTLRGWTVVTLLDGTARFEAFVPGTPDQNRLNRLEVGSRLSVVGVPVDASPDAKPTSGSSLFLSSAESLALLELPPSLPALPEPIWWTATRVAYLCGGFLAVTLFGTGWLSFLRLQVRKAAGEVKQQYEEKAKLERQLRQAAKLEAVGRLAGGIAHDFNNLLTVINGCAELLSDEAGQKGGRLCELATDIREAGERAAALTGQLLTFSRKREVQVSAIDINEVVTDSVRLLDRVIGENIHIETILAGDLPRVCGEQGLLQQVVMNLAVNAKDAMPGGGTLTLTTTRISEPVVASINNSAESVISTRQFIRLTVSDTGVGMTAEVKSRIFEPFFTTKDVGNGTGLGLATVYGIIQTVRGRIHVDSAVGLGTTFHIDLRVHGQAITDSDFPLPGRPQPPRRDFGSTKLTGTTVLVVEDNEMVRKLIVSGLSADGATVLAAGNPSQALRVLADYPNRVDVMVTDVVMPGMNGRMLADRVRVERPAVQVVFMSGYTVDEVLREGVLEDQVEFLQKPFTPDHLTNRLIGVLSRRASRAAEDRSQMTEVGSHKA